MSQVTLREYRLQSYDKYLIYANFFVDFVEKNLTIDTQGVALGYVQIALFRLFNPCRLTTTLYTLCHTHRNIVSSSETSLLLPSIRECLSCQPDV